MRVGPATVEAIFAAPEFAELIAEYDDEARIPGLPDPTIKLTTYLAIERAGMLHPFAAWDDSERLVGFIAVLANLVPHYATPLICTESFFVAKAARASGAGLSLLRVAEAKARELGATGLLVSAPTEGALARLLPRLDYRQASSVYFKRFLDA